MEGIWLAFGFIVTSVIAVTAIPSLPAPFVYMPLLFASGVVVMNRVRVVDGALWIALSGFVLQAHDVAHGRIVATLIAAGVGTVLAERVFAKRSVYALLGLAATTGGVLVACEWVHHLFALWFNTSETAGMTLREAWWTWAFLMLVVYVAFVVAVTLRRWLGKRFLVR